MKISIIIPVYNEIGNLEILQEKLAATLSGQPQEWEIIYVDDHSTDGSYELLKKFSRENPQTRVIRLTRNFGQTLAIQAGIDHSRAEVLIFMDADLQNDPADIPKLIAKIQEGFDLVSGWRRKRKDPLITKRIPSFLSNMLISFLFKVRIHDIGCTLKAYRREAISNIRLYGEMHRLMPLYALMRGASMTEIEVSHNPRNAGQTHYGLSRIFKVSLDLITVRFFETYSTKPIYFFGGAGIFFMGAGAMISILVIIRKVFLHGAWISPLLFIALLLITVGVQLIFLGVMAEIVIRIYYNPKSETAYIIKEIS